MASAFTGKFRGGPSWSDSSGNWCFVYKVARSMHRDNCILGMNVLQAAHYSSSLQHTPKE